MRRLTNAFRSYFLLILISAIGVLNLLKTPTEYSALENRYLKNRPSISIDGILNSGRDGFAQSFESYFNDQFVARDIWISVKSLSEELLGKIENNEVFYGEEGYMFDVLRNIDYVRFNRNIDYIKNFCLRYPAENYTVMLVPSSYEILKDKFSFSPQNADQGELILSVSQATDNLGVKTIDLVPLFLSNTGEELYYKTDHHWTSFGAYIAAGAFLESRSLDSDKIPPLLLEDNNFLGTYFSRSKRIGAKADTIRFYDSKFSRITVNNEQKTTLYDNSKLGTRDKYASFLWGNNGLTIIENDASPERKLLIIKDSYANSMIPFLTNKYSRIIVIDPRYYSENYSEIMSKESFDDILFLYGVKNFASDSDLFRIIL
jgi:hypothetical protein